jgi:hypothetical protein
MNLKNLNKKYGFSSDTNWVKCRICEKKYPSQMEEDYTGECSDCEELSWKEKADIISQKENMIVDLAIKHLEEKNERT